VVSRDRQIHELATVEFTGSLTEAFGRYAWALREVSTRWDTELGLASTDVRAALTAVRRPDALEWTMLWPVAVLKVKAWRVARRLRRAQTLVASITKRAERFPREYALLFLQGVDGGKGGER
jgi:hypothetical protein